MHIYNSSNEATEVLSNCNPIHLHINLRQAEELLRIYSKHDEQLINEEFNKSTDDPGLRGKKTTCDMLLDKWKVNFPLRMWQRNTKEMM